MTQSADIDKTIKQIQSIISIETKNIQKRGVAGEGKLVALSKLCNSLRQLIQLTVPTEVAGDDGGYSEANFRDRWQREIEHRRAIL